MFDCKLTADPKPVVTWQHGNKPITVGGRHKLNHTTDKNNHNISLEISNPSAADGGEYKAIAKNSLGESTATITLNFEGETILTQWVLMNTDLDVELAHIMIFHVQYLVLDNYDLNILKSRNEYFWFIFILKCDYSSSISGDTNNTDR